MTDANCLASELTMFHLENFGDILDLLRNTDQLLRTEVDRVLRAFNPGASLAEHASSLQEPPRLIQVHPPL